jgi:hypothetical protein
MKINNNLRMQKLLVEGVKFWFGGRKAGIYQKG